MPKNSFTIGDDSYLDSHRKKIFIGDEMAPFELSSDEVVLQKVKVNSISEGELPAEEGADLRLSTDTKIVFQDNLNNYVDFTPYAGSSFILGLGQDLSDQSMYFLGYSSKCDIFLSSQFASGYTAFRFSMDSGQPNRYRQEAPNLGASNYFQIDTTTFAETSISTESSTDVGHLELDIDGDITLDSATGNITAKDNGGNYTPSSDYHIATKKYVDEKKQKHFMQWSMRWSTDANPSNSGTNRRRWFTPQITYGPNDYVWDSYQTATNPRTSWYDSMTPSIVVPSDMTLVRYALYGSITWQSASDTGTILLEVKKNTNPLTWDSTAQSIPLTTIGTRQSKTWGSQMYTSMEESVNISMSEGDIIIPSLCRDSFLTSSSSRYVEGNFVLEFEKAVS